MKGLFVLLLTGLLASLLAGCATPNMQERWSDELPPVDYFEAHYETDAQNQQRQSLNNYLYWVSNFYQGTAMYRRGWNDMAPRLLEEVEDEAERERLAEQLEELGRTLAAEWGKNEDLRRIRNSHLSVWVNTMRQAISQNQIQAKLDAIEDDARALIAGDLATDRIDLERYYPTEEDDPFR